MVPNPVRSSAPNGPATPMVMVDEDFSELSLVKSNEEKTLAERATQHYIWRLVIFVVIIHLIVLHSITVMPFFKWQTWLSFVFLWIWAAFGMTAGAHRLWCHRSFKANLPLRIILMLGHNMSGIHSTIPWVRDHRVHHRYTDTDADPYNAKRGFFFSHMGWTMMTKHPEVIRKGKMVDISDVESDPVCVFEKRHNRNLFLLTSLILPTIIPVMFWGETWHYSFAAAISRYVILSHAIAAVNSFAHIYGNRPFNKTITSAQNPIVSIFVLGEGWHNFHHVFPWDYRTSEFGFLNGSMHLIRMFEYIGWAWDLKTASPELVTKVARRYGDGTYPDLAEYAPEVPEAAANDSSVVDSLPPSSKIRTIGL